MNTVIDFNIDKERYFKSIERLEEIYRRVSLKATESSEHRCPYKDAKSKCTASFKCRNQSPHMVCTGSDDLDYRSAWDL